MQIFLLLVLWCVRFRAFSEVQSQVRDRVQQPVPAPAQGQSESMIDYWRGSRAWSFQAFPGTSESLRKVLEMSRFLCEMNAANYCMALRHRLFLLMLVEGEHWRAHSKQIFKYKSGAWVQASALEINAWDVFLATEGLFICIADIMEQQEVQLKWKWDDVQATVAQLLNAHEGPCLEALDSQGKGI